MALARPLAQIIAALSDGGRMTRYAQILAFGSGARLFGLASQFVVLLILSRMLLKGSFGDLMTAFGVYRLMGTALGVGPSLVLLFHISRRPGDKALEIKLHRYSFLLGAVVSATLAGAGALLAHPLAAMLGKPELAVWLLHLAPFAIFSTLLIVSTGALEGRSRITESMLLGEVAPNVVRIVLLPCIPLFDLPDIYVAHVLTLSVLAPWLWSATRLWDPSVRGMQPWARTDFSYCGKFVVATLFASQLNTVDIVVASALFSSEAVADYALAARIAALFTFFALVLLKQFSPHAGHLLETGDKVALAREVELCRRLTIGLCAITIGGLLLLTPFLLPLFGNYLGAQTLLIWLAIPAFVFSFYATSDRLLVIAGQANVALLLTASSFFVLVTTPFLTAPWLGLPAVPAAMIFSSLVFSPLVAARVQQMLGIRTIRPLDAAAMAAGCLALAAYAIRGPVLAEILACGLLGAIGIYYAISAMQRTNAGG
jgi:O-antigen/teichoic acid export membrane protein